MFNWSMCKLIINGQLANDSFKHRLIGTSTNCLLSFPLKRVDQMHRFFLHEFDGWSKGIVLHAGIKVKGASKKILRRVGHGKLKLTWHFARDLCNYSCLPAWSFRDHLIDCICFDLLLRREIICIVQQFL